MKVLAFDCVAGRAVETDAPAVAEVEKAAHEVATAKAAKVAANLDKWRAEIAALIAENKTTKLPLAKSRRLAILTAKVVLQIDVDNDDDGT